MTLALPLVSLPARGQRASNARGTLDVGSAVLRQPGLPASSVLTLGSLLSYTGERLALSSNALAARTPDDRWTAQAILSGALYAPGFQPRRWEIAATANAFGLTGDPPTSSAQLVAREHFLLPAAGVYVGAGGGGVVSERIWRPAILAQAGVYTRRGLLGEHLLAGGITFTDTRRELRVEQQGMLVRAAAPVSYADLSGYWERDHARVDLLAGGGVRLGMRGASAATPWLSGSLTWWLTSRLGVVGSAGRALEDVVRGVPSARYASIALRLGLADHRVDTPPSRDEARTPMDDALRVTIDAAGGDQRVIAVRAPRAISVELMGDFTDWSAVALSPDSTRGGFWRLALPIPPGMHRVLIRIDAGTWIAPANLPSVADDFGGTVGLLAVP